MSRIPPLRIDELAPELQTAFKDAEKLMGFTANDVLTMARNPLLLQALDVLVKAVYAPGQVNDDLKRLVGLMTSTAAGCRYCMSHTALSSEQHGVPQEKLDAVWEFETSPLFSEAERAALRVALHAGQSPCGVTDAMFSELAKHYDVDAQVEIVAVISMFGFLNRWNATIATDVEGLPAAALERVEGSPNTSC